MVGLPLLLQPRSSMVSRMVKGFARLIIGAHLLPEGLSYILPVIVQGLDSGNIPKDALEKGLESGIGLIVQAVEIIQPALGAVLIEHQNAPALDGKLTDGVIIPSNVGSLHTPEELVLCVLRVVTRAQGQVPVTIQHIDDLANLPLGVVSVSATSSTV